MAVFRIEKKKDYTVMSNHHLRNTKLSLVDPDLTKEWYESLWDEMSYLCDISVKAKNAGIFSIDRKSVL